MSPTSHRRPLRALLALGLLATLLAGTAELHFGDHDPLSDLAASAGAALVFSEAHPTRPADCLEQPVTERAAHCPACLVRVQSRADHPQPSFGTVPPGPSEGWRADADPTPAAAALRPPSSRGPPPLV
jgi:hypothetical protein